MTFKRYKEALLRIAAGVDDPAAVAIEALRSRISPKKPPKPIDPNKKTQDQLRTERQAEQMRLAEEWIEKGGSMAQFARDHGRNTAWASRHVWLGIKWLTHPARKRGRFYEQALQKRQGKFYETPEQRRAQGLSY